MDINYPGTDIKAVITSYNQGSMILEAVQSVCRQTLLPKRIIIVDDGSTDKNSLAVLNSIKNNSDLSVPVTIHFQENGGVSAARNTGINKTQSSMVLASSWIRTFGVLMQLFVLRVEI